MTRRMEIVQRDEVITSTVLPHLYGCLEKGDPVPSLEGAILSRKLGWCWAHLVWEGVRGVGPRVGAG